MGKKKASESLERKKELPVEKYYSTGSTLLDLAISNKYPGGIGGGRITHLYGDTSTAKSVIIQEVLGSAQRQKDYGVFVDVEYTLDHDRANLFGLNTGKFEDPIYRLQTQETEEKAVHTVKGKSKAISEFVEDTIKDNKNFACLHPKSIEQLYDNVLSSLVDMAYVEKKNFVVGIDSLSALPSEVELDSELGDLGYGMTRPKQMSTALRKFVADLSVNNISLLFIDQIRENPTGYGKKHKVSGGTALPYYASSRVFMHNPVHIKNEYDQTIGITVSFTVEKSKISPPFRTGKLSVLFDMGIDDVRANIEWLLENTKKIDCLLSLAGSWYSWGDTKLGQGLEKAISYIEENNLEKDLEKEVARVWNIVYETPQRKKRYE